MNRSRWLMVGACVMGWMLIGWTLHWFTQELMAEGVRDPDRLAYAPADNAPPAVDLAGIQRSWPNGLDSESQARRLRAYLSDMEGRAPPPAAGAPRPASTPEPDLGTLLASADAAIGQQKAQVCRSCHAFDAGGHNGLGPGLWQVVGRDIASRPGYAYSAAMAAQDGSWTYDRLYKFLASPGRAVPGTKMTFAGFRRAEDRANVIRYLATLGGNPPPLPPQGAAGAKSR